MLIAAVEKNVISLTQGKAKRFLAWDSIKKLYLTLK